MLTVGFFFCMIIACHASKLDSIAEKTSATISVQKFDGTKFYNYVKLAPTVAPDNSESTVQPGSGREGDEAVFTEDDSDTEITSTLSPSSSEDVVITGDVDDGESIDTPSVPSNTPDAPTGSDTAPGDGIAASPENPPAGAVPGQPGEDALDSSSSSSSESDSSSSSSEEYREAFKKAWERKIKNELNLGKGKKSKDVLARVYSPQAMINKLVKNKLAKRL